MHGYKLSILTLAVGLLGLIELWSRVYCFLPSEFVWALGFGSFFGAMFYCLLRIAFFGKFVELSYEAPARSGETLMLNRVRIGIEDRLDNYIKEESKTWSGEFWKRMIRWGRTASAGLLPSTGMSILVIAIATLAMSRLPNSFFVVCS